MKWTLYKEYGLLRLEDCNIDELDSVTSFFNRKIQYWKDRRPHYYTDELFKENRYLFIGLWGELVKLAAANNFKLKVDGLVELLQCDYTLESYKKVALKTFENHSKITPYEYQIDSVYKILKHKFCQLELATGAGKTLVFYLMFREHLKRQEKMLIITPNVTLVTQPIDEFEEYTVDGTKYLISPEHGGSKRVKDADVVIGTYQTLSMKARPKIKKGKKMVPNPLFDPDFFKQFQAVAIDEAHGTDTNSIKAILSMLSHCKFRYGMSGTLPEKGSHESLVLQAYLGPVVKKVSTTELQELKQATPLTIKSIRLKHSNNRFQANLYKLAKQKRNDEAFRLEKLYIRQCKERIELIAKIVTAQQGPSLVAFDNTDIGKALEAEIKLLAKDRTVHYIDGSVSLKKRNAIFEEIRKSDNDILVGSYKTIGTGLNIKNLVRIYLTQSFKSQVIIRQTIGRGIRTEEGKDMVYIYDFMDDMSHEYINEFTNRKNTWRNNVYKHGIERRKIYEKQGFPWSEIVYKL